MEDQVVRTVSRLTVPFIQLYGVYIVLHGHLSPGGGFAGGAIFGVGLVLLALSFNLEEGTRKLSPAAASTLESGGALGFALTGLVALWAGAGYLANRAAGFPLGNPGQLLSSGAILAVTFFIGIKVASTVATLFHQLIGEEDQH